MQIIMHECVVLRAKSGANLMGILWEHPLRTSDHEDPFRVVGDLVAEMLDLRFIIVSEVIETQAVLILIHNVYELVLQHLALGCVHIALKNRILDPLTVIHAFLRDPAQTPFSQFILCADVIGD